ncbi:preprotein translocase subunit YajC [Clavibacter tessellarius]|uniref:preprotein translocase subunit YajC n=1 Tax=Clavibacter tessellarius TaxID=31965 RepID=UPI0032442723
MDPFTLIMFAVLALLIFFMFRNSRKRQKDLAALQTQMVPGAEVMTASGIYGTLVSFDEENNLAYLEVSPGTVLKLHRQTIARVVEPTVAVADDASEARGRRPGHRRRRRGRQHGRRPSPRRRRRAHRAPLIHRAGGRAARRTRAGSRPGQLPHPSGTATPRRPSRGESRVSRWPSRPHRYARPGASSSGCS